MKIKTTGVAETIRAIRVKSDALIAEGKSQQIDKAIAALKANTPVDTGEARDGWRREGDAIVNDVEHVIYLNEGSSKQAPAHFIERTLLEQPGVMPNGLIVKVKE